MSQASDQLRFGLKMRQHFDVLRSFLDELRDGMQITVEEHDPNTGDTAMALIIDQVNRDNLPKMIGSGTHVSFVIPENDGSVRYLTLRAEKP